MNVGGHFFGALVSFFRGLRGFMKERPRRVSWDCRPLGTNWDLPPLMLSSLHILHGFRPFFALAHSFVRRSSSALLPFLSMRLSSIYFAIDPKNV